MNIYFLVAGILCFILGLLHSILGEYLIFKNKRNKGSLVPSKAIAELKEQHLRIIWATWHLVSFLGWCIGAFLVKVSSEQGKLDSEIIEFMIQSTVYTMFASSLLVFIGTKGKHPAWVILLLIGILLIFGYR